MQTPSWGINNSFILGEFESHTFPVNLGATMGSFVSRYFLIYSQVTPCCTKTAHFATANLEWQVTPLTIWQKKWVCIVGVRKLVFNLVSQPAPGLACGCRRIGIGRGHGCGLRFPRWYFHYWTYTLFLYCYRLWLKIGICTFMLRKP